MADTRTCPFCSKETGIDDTWCRHCDAELKNVQDSEGSAFSPGSGKSSGDVSDRSQPEDEFSELDYQPKKKAGWLVPAFVITLVLLMVAAVVMVLRDDDLSPAANKEIEMPEVELPDEDLAVDEPEEPDQEEDLEEEEPEVPERGTAYPPDLDVLELTLINWLIERIGDSEAILLHTEKLEDMDLFFERYDLEEDNVIVYQVESADDEFATVLFGPPYSEWYIRAVFYWDGWDWVFLREIEIR